MQPLSFRRDSEPSLDCPCRAPPLSFGGGRLDFSQKSVLHPNGRNSTFEQGPFSLQGSAMGGGWGEVRLCYLGQAAKALLASSTAVFVQYCKHVAHQAHHHRSLLICSTCEPSNPSPHQPFQHQRTHAHANPIRRKELPLTGKRSDRTLRHAGERGRSHACCFEKYEYSTHNNE